MTPIVVTPPTVEPITLAEAKAHLRQVFSDDDAYITSLITAAREMVEGYTNRALAAQRIRIGADGFCPVVKLPRLPYIGGLVVKYLDENGNPQTLASTVYRVNEYTEPPEVTLAPGQSWPATTSAPGSVTYEYDVGYPDATSVPMALKQWMLLAIGALYDHRDELGAAEIYRLPVDFMMLLWQPYMVYE